MENDRSKETDKIIQLQFKTYLDCHRITNDFLLKEFNIKLRLQTASKVAMIQSIHEKSFQCMIKPPIIGPAILPEFLNDPINPTPAPVWRESIF